MAAQTWEKVALANPDDQFLVNILWLLTEWQVIRKRKKMKEKQTIKVFVNFL